MHKYLVRPDHALEIKIDQKHWFNFEVNTFGIRGKIWDDGSIIRPSISLTLFKIKFTWKDTMRHNYWMCYDACRRLVHLEDKGYNVFTISELDKMCGYSSHKLGSIEVSSPNLLECYLKEPYRTELKTLRYATQS